MLSINTWNTNGIEHKSHGTKCNKLHDADVINQLIDADVIEVDHLPGELEALIGRPARAFTVEALQYLDTRRAEAGVRQAS